MLLRRLGDRKRFDSFKVHKVYIFRKCADKANVSALKRGNKDRVLTYFGGGRFLDILFGETKLEFTNMSFQYVEEF